MKRLREILRQCEAAAIRLLTGIWIMFALVATAGYAYWRMHQAWTSGTPVQVQNAASWFQTIGLFIAAIITWAYVRTTERTLQVMRDAPELLIEVLSARVTVDGSNANASLLIRVTNLAAARLAVLHVEATHVAQQKAFYHGFSVEGLARLVANTEVNPGTTNLKIYATVMSDSIALQPRMPLTVKLVNLSAPKELSIRCEARVSQINANGRAEEVPESAQT